MDETPHRFEPAFLEGRLPQDLTDLALKLQAASLRLPGRLPPAAVHELAGLVLIMNSTYSNLIEGNDTRPAEIEAALARGSDTEDRPLLIEGTAHVKLQARIDASAAAGGDGNGLHQGSAPRLLRGDAGNAQSHEAGRP